MATIRLCDWTKERLSSDEEAFVVTIGDQEFEVGEKGREALLKQLEGDEPPGVPKVIEKVVEREAPPPPLQAAQPGGIQIQSDSPFEPGPNSMPEPPQAQAAPQEQPQAATSEETLDVPEDTRKPLRKPSASLAKRIVEEATIFEEGSLPSLTMGAAAQREALRKLRELEESQNDKLRRRVQKGVRINFDNEYGGPR